MSNQALSRTLAALILAIGINKAIAEPIVTNTLATDFEVKAGALYWSDPGEFPILKLPLAGGALTPLTRRIGTPVSVSYSNGILFWVDSRTGSTPYCTGPGVIRLLNETVLATNLTTPLAAGVDCAGSTSDIVSTPNLIYWATSVASPNEYRIQRFNRATGVMVTMVKTTRPIVAMARDATYLYWMEQSFPDPGVIRRKPLVGGVGTLVVKPSLPFVSSFAVSGTDVVYAVLPYPMYSKAEFYRVPVTGGLSSKIVDTVAIPRKLAATDTDVFWIDSTSLQSAPLSSGSANIVAEGLGSPVDLILTVDSAYWLETPPGQKSLLRSVGLQGGDVTTLANNLYSPGRLAKGASWAYWTEGDLISGFGRVARVPLTGGVTRTVVGGITAENPNIAVAGAYVYVADNFTIKRMPTTPGKTELVAMAGNPVADLVSDGVHVYWTDEIFGIVYRAPVAGGAPELLSSSPPQGPGGRIRLAGDHVYWMVNYDTLRRVPKSGGTAATLATDLPFLSDFVVGGQVFFSEWDTQALRKVPLTGGTIQTVLSAQCQFAPCSLAQSPTDIYWVDQDTVEVVPKIGGTSTLLSFTGGSLFNANAIGLDDTYVYWSDLSNKTINRVLRLD